MKHVTTGAFGPLRTRAALCTLVLAAGLAGCGSGGSDAEPGPPPAGNDPPQALALARPGELLSYVQQRLRERPAGAGGLLNPVWGTFVDATVAVGTADAPARSAPLRQEEGVDEADLLQTDGTRLYSLQPADAGGLRLKAYQREASGARLLQALELPNPGAVAVEPHGLHLSPDGRALAVLAQTWEGVVAGELCAAPCVGLPVQGRAMRSRVVVQRLQATDGGVQAGERLVIDGQLVDSRRIGKRLVLVTTHQPLLPVDLLPLGAPAAQREQAIAGLTLAEVLPGLRRNGAAPVPLLTDGACWLQTANASDAVRLTTLTLLDLDAPTLAPSSRCFAGGAEAVYLTTQSLYIATTRSAYPEGGLTLMYPVDMRTDIHKFTLDAAGPSYRGSGEVAGHLGWDAARKPLRLSEHNGDLRVLSFTGSTGWLSLDDAATQPASPATLSVLRERASDHSLQTVATLPNARRPAALGKPGEQVYGVRLVGDRGYVVTFRRTDPLYVLDLSDPADPRAAGELELAGFSEQLFPLPGGLLLGAGRDADARGMVTGLKMALFDVADAARPKLLAGFSSGGPASSSALDGSRHGLNYLLKDGVVRIALPVNLAPPGPTFAPGGWVSGLQRWEVDTAARTMRERPMQGTRNEAGSVWLDRSLQVGDQVFHLAGGELVGYAW